MRGQDIPETLDLHVFGSGAGVEVGGQRPGMEEPLLYLGQAGAPYHGGAYPGGGTLGGV